KCKNSGCVILNLQSHYMVSVHQRLLTCIPSLGCSTRIDGPGISPAPECILGVHRLLTKVVRIQPGIPPCATSQHSLPANDGSTVLWNFCRAYNLLNNYRGHPLVLIVGARTLAL